MTSHCHLGPEDILAATHNKFILLFTVSATVLTEAVRQLEMMGGQAELCPRQQHRHDPRLPYSDEASWEPWSLVAVTSKAFGTILPTWPSFWSEDNQPPHLSWKGTLLSKAFRPGCWPSHTALLGCLCAKTWLEV